MGNRKKRKKRYSPSILVIGYIFAYLGVTIAMIILFVVLLCLLVFRGPSKEASRLLTLSANETSAMKFLPGLFLTDQELNDILNRKESGDDFGYLPIDTTSVMGNDSPSGGFDEPATSVYELIDVKGPTYKGKMFIVHDPSLVHIVSLDSFGNAGMTLGEFSDKYDAIAATNAGGFEDEGGTGKGGIPDGLVIKNGSIAYGSAGSRYLDVIGFDANHVLHVGDMTGQEAINIGIVEGASFVNGPVLIKDGVKNTSMGSGINPRTCIGQCADGTVLLLAVEGRFPDSLGATFDDLADLMLEHGAINAGNFDGGSSSGLYYEGQRVTRSCSVIGDRGIPTAVVVQRKE